MENYEGMSEWRAPEAGGFLINEPEVQASLLLFAYRERLKREGGDENEIQSIHVADPEATDPAIALRAVEAWGKETDGMPCPSVSFRKYVDAHPGERIDTSSDEALAKLLADIAPTRH